MKSNKLFTIPTALTLALFLMAGTSLADKFNLTIPHPVEYGTYQKLLLDPHDFDENDDTCNSAEDVGMLAYHQTDETLKVCKEIDGDFTWKELSGLWGLNDVSADNHILFLSSNDKWKDTTGEKINVGIGTSTPQNNFHIVADQRSNTHYLADSMSGIILEGDTSALQLIGSNGSQNMSHLFLSSSDDSGNNFAWTINHLGPVIHGNKFSIGYAEPTGDFYAMYDPGPGNYAIDEHVTITTDGKMGFGKSLPRAHVHIYTNTLSNGVLLENGSPTLRWEDTESNEDDFQIKLDNDLFMFSSSDTGTFTGNLMSIGKTGELTINNTPLNAGYLNVGVSNATTNTGILIDSTNPNIMFNSRNHSDFDIEADNNVLTFASEVSSTMYDRLMLFQDGEIAIGTSSPQAHLHINTGASLVDNLWISPADLILKHGTAVDFNITASSNSLQLRPTDGGTGYNTKFVLDSLGQVTIGDSDGDEHLKIMENAAEIADLSIEHSNPTLQFVDLADGTPANNSDMAITCCNDNGSGLDSLKFTADQDSDGVYETDIIHILENGNVGINVANPTDKLVVAGNINVTGCYSVNAGGGPWPTAGDCVSDGNLKENIEPLNNSSDRLAKLNPVTYEYKDAANGKGAQAGLIAQEVKEIFPEWVEEKDDGTLYIKYGMHMQMHLIQAIKELNEENKLLEEKINELRKRVHGGSF